MKKKKLKYYAFFGSVNSLGIIKKLDNTIEAARGLGYEAEVEHFINRPRGLFGFIKCILRGNEEVIILRHYDLFMPFIMPFLLYRRLRRGTNIVLDVPTPRTIQLKEFRYDDKDKAHIVLRKILNYVSWTWILIPFTRIIQYAEESNWFSFGVKGKTIKIGNGIKIDSSLPVVNNLEKDELHLIAVATLAAWHGYDRLIRAVSVVKNNEPKFKVKVTIVGDGPVYNDLKKLISELDLEGVVRLTGTLYGDSLDEVFVTATVGVSSLGLFRKGLAEASDLKTREYMARGLCVIGAGKDPDFPDDSPYRFLVSNDESIQSIVDLLLSIRDLKLPDPLEVRKFAEEKLTYNAKIKTIIGC